MITVDSGAAGPSRPPSADNPEAYIARDRRRALAARTEMPDRVRGSTIFADISGFTPLTETLRTELGPRRGAEELTANLDRVFYAVIAELDRFGGDVIYFSGDAITGWIDGDDGSRAVAAGLAMQQAIQRVGLVITPAGSSVQLAMKVAVAVGRARRFVVGDPTIQLIDVLAGKLMDRLALVEHHALQGEVVLDQSAMGALKNKVEIREHRQSAEGHGAFPVVERLAVEVDEAPVAEPEQLDPEVVRQWVLPTIYDRITTGRGVFLAELRPAYPVFLRFAGIDFDADDEAADKLNDFVRQAQRVCDRFGGNVLQLTLGDKGAYLYGVFGSPIAHEDDAARAAAAALELVHLDSVTAARDIQVGIAYGQLRSGTYGHTMRRTFVCLGDAVNLAARLMSAAPAGQIYATEDVRAAAGEGFAWERLPPLKAKGKAREVEASALLSSVASAPRRRVRYELPMVGRATELEVLDSALAHARGGRSQVVGISAEAGLGKSRLVAEFVRSVRRRAFPVVFGECQSYGQNTSYAVWREIWRRLLGVEDDADEDHQRAAIHRALASVDPVLVERAPLLADVVGVAVAETELTRSFDAKLRKTSLEDLLAACLRARTQSEPVLVVLEDCHWMDELSRDLLVALVRATADRQALFVLAYRPAETAGGGMGVEQLAQFSEVVLAELGIAEMQQVVKTKAEQLFGIAGNAAPRLVDLVMERAQGNPFYAEEVLSYVASRRIDPPDAASLAALDLPDSLHSLILSRVDAMPEKPRQALKVASVVGRTFEAPVLPGAYPDLGELDDVLGRLEVLRSAELITLDQPETLTYLFRHVVIQEVCYDGLPFALRRVLHRSIGEFIERTGADDLERYVDLLAHHFWNSDDEGKKRAYLEHAADAARARYANAAAIDYYGRLISLLGGVERAEALLKMGKVLELTGEWQRAEQIESEAHELAREAGDRGLMARCETALADVARKQGRYEDANRRLSHAAEEFRALNDDEGLGLALHAAGTLAAQQGDYDAAQRAYQGSLDIRLRLNDLAAVGSLHSNFAVIAEYRGDYAEARAANERALAIRTDAGDRWAIGVSQNNLGMIALQEGNLEDARARFEEAMRLNREVGDGWMVAISHNNLGNANRELGALEAAREHYAASLEALGRYDDRWALAFLLEDVAILAAQQAQYDTALRLAGAAQSLRDALGSPRSPALVEQLAQRLAGARSALGPRADVAVAEGAALTSAEAAALALEFSGQRPDGAVDAKST